MKRVLLLIPTTSYKTHDFMTAAERLGVEVTVGSDRAQVLEAFSDGGSVTIDFTDRAKGLQEILAFAWRHPLSAILGAEDLTTLLAAEASAALGLPHNPPEAVRRTVDKGAQRQALKRAGLQVPEFHVVRADEGLEKAAAHASYPCVLKPLSLGASRGVIRVDTTDEFIAAAERIARIVGRADCEILVEAFISGREFALEAVLVSGQLHPLALFDKPDPLDGPTFEETLYITPARLPDPERASILEAAQAMAAALGLREGPIHAEFRVNPEGVWPLEMAARTIGGLCSRSLHFEGGMSLEELVLRHATGEDARTWVGAGTASGVMMIPVPARGRLIAVEGQAAALTTAGVEDLQVTIPIGQSVEPLPEGDRYLGFIFARAENPDGVERALREAHACLRIQID